MFLNRPAVIGFVLSLAGLFCAIDLSDLARAPGLVQSRYYLIEVIKYADLSIGPLLCFWALFSKKLEPMTVAGRVVLSIVLCIFLVTVIMPLLLALALALLKV